MSINRIPINLQPINFKYINNEQNQFDNQSSNLSPAVPINNNDILKSFLSNLTTQNNNNNNIEPENNQNNFNSLPKIQNDQNEILKKCLKKGDLIFLDQNSSNDNFNTGINVKNGNIFYWKKFDLNNYYSKLEPYFIMEGASDKIYKFNKIISDSNESDSNINFNKYVYLIFEPHFGDLHSYMKEKKRLDEFEAVILFRQVVEVVKSCHENGIIIRDIKLKKFVFLNEEKTKIGLANLEDCLVLDDNASDDFIKSQQGCPAYVSPEVLNPSQTRYSGRYSDSWSLGIILYTLLVGRYPFHHPNITNMFAKIARGKFIIPPSISISLDAKLLLRSLIRFKPEERLLPSEILNHSWLRSNDFGYQSNQSNSNNELKFSSSQVNKIQLGISVSAPMRIGSNLNNSLLTRAGLNNKNNENLNNDEDRVVPGI